TISTPFPYTTLFRSVLESLQQGALPEILAGYRGITYVLSGEQEERAEALGGLANLVPLALLVIYALLAIPLKSYLQPLVIMSVRSEEHTSELQSREN